MDTYHIIRRLDWIRAAIESGINCTDIAAHWDISKKTAQRDIDFLREYYKMNIGYNTKTRKFYQEAP